MKEDVKLIAVVGSRKAFVNHFNEQKDKGKEIVFHKENQFQIGKSAYIHVREVRDCRGYDWDDYRLLFDAHSIMSSNQIIDELKHRINFPRKKAADESNNRRD